MKTVMTVDDSASMRQMVAFTLQRSGYSVLEAVDGRDALDRLSGQDVHLFILDLNMPNMDGIELTKQLRMIPAYKFVPIVLLTTESQTAKVQEARSAGATGWILKPFQPEKLMAVVNKVVR